MKLKLSRLPEGDAYRGIVRIGKEEMEILGVMPGDAVSINRKTAARVWRGKCEGILADEFTAKNAGAEFGELVEVERCEAENAVSVVLSGEFNPWGWRLAAKTLSAYLGIVLKGWVVTAGDFLPLNLNTLSILRVLDTKPEGFVRIGYETEIKVNRR